MGLVYTCCVCVCCADASARMLALVLADYCDAREAYAASAHAARLEQIQVEMTPVVTPRA